MTDPQLSRVLTELGRELTNLARRQDRLERGARTAGLTRSSIDNGTLVVKDGDGNPTHLIGLQDDGSYQIAGVAGFGTVIADHVIAGAIDGIVITGSTIQTAAAAPQVQMDGTRNALFIYDNAANLIFSAAAVTGTDSSGNPFATGPEAVNFTLCDLARTVTLAITLGGPGSNAVWIGKGRNCYVVVSNPGNFNQAETWHAMTGAYLNSWSDLGTGHVAGQYRLTAENEVEVCGLIQHASTSGSSDFFQLPAGYRPSSIIGIGTPMIWNTTGTCALTVDTTGTLSFSQMPAGTTQVAFNGRFPLGI